MTKIPRLVLVTLFSLLLSACASKFAGPLEVSLPLRAPLEKVQVKTVDKDGVCPGDSHFYMGEEDFKSLLRNITNTETYIQQLEIMLKSLSKPQE